MAVVYAATHRNRKKFAIKMLHPELPPCDRAYAAASYAKGTSRTHGRSPRRALAVLDDDVAEDGSAFPGDGAMLEGAALNELAARREGGRITAGRPRRVHWRRAPRRPRRRARQGDRVHRDLKPANLFLTKDGRLAVLDFGIARLRDGTSSDHATQTGTVLGTPAFMAPEQARAESEKIDAQTDLWGVGATLFTLLSGVHVHDGENATRMVARTGTTPPRPLATAAPDVPAPIARVIDRAIAFEKKDRWASAQAMRNALAVAILEATGTGIAPLPKEERLSGLEATELRETNAPPWSSGAGLSPTRDATGAEEPSRGSGLSPGMGTNGVAVPELPTAQSPTARRPRSRLVGALILALAASATLVVWRCGAVAPISPRPIAVSDATSPLRADRPPATPPIAAAEYEAAIQANYEVKFTRIIDHLRAAVSSDPALAGAHLRLAVHLAEMGRATEAHAAFMKAAEHRASLGDFNTALLDAWEPRFRDPPDVVEHARRLERLARRFPEDPYVATLLGDCLLDSSRSADAVAAFARARAIDPMYVPAYVEGIQQAHFEGNGAQATALLNQCIAMAPSAVACILLRMQRAFEEDRCGDARADARRVLSVDPTAEDAFQMLANSMFALGEPLEAVAEALRRGDAQVADPIERREAELGTNAALAVVAGDFSTAAKAETESASLVTAERGTPLLLFVGTVAQYALHESADVDGARTAARRARSAASVVGTSEQEISIQAARLAFVSANAGLTSRDELRTELARLAASNDDAAGDQKREAVGVWYALYGGATSEQDGRDAVAALDAIGGRPAWGAQAWSAGLVGRVCARRSLCRGVPLLAKAVSVCNGKLDAEFWCVAGNGPPRSLAREGGRRRGCARGVRARARPMGATPSPDR